MKGTAQVLKVSGGAPVPKPESPMGQRARAISDPSVPQVPAAQHRQGWQSAPTNAPSLRVATLNSAAGCLQGHQPLGFAGESS